MPLPEKYDVTIVVNPAGDPDTELQMKLGSIKREAIMAPGYPQAITNVVKLLEDSVEWD